MEAGSEHNFQTKSLGKQTKIPKVLFKQKQGPAGAVAIYCLFIYACPVIVLSESFISLSCNANMKGGETTLANFGFKLDGKVSAQEKEFSPMAARDGTL